MALEQFHKQQIDTAIEHLLSPFFSLPPKDSLAALAELMQLLVYPPPENLFANKVYQSSEVQESLQQLSKIMRNRQPQNPVKYTEDQNAEVHHGIFGLRDKENVTAADVHAYMKYRLALVACTVIAMPIAVNITNTWKEKKKTIFYKLFAEWINNGEIPEDLKKIIQSEVKMGDQTVSILQHKIAQALKEEYFKPFSTYLEKMKDEAVGSNEPEKISLADIVNHLFSILTPETQDNPEEDQKMVPCLETLFSGKVWQQPVFLELQVFKQESFRSVQTKLQQQIQEGKDENKNLDAVALSFVEVAKAQEGLNLHRGSLSIPLNELEKIEKICTDYVSHLQANSADEQLPLTREDRQILQQFLLQVDDVASEKKLMQRLGNFFALWFLAKKEGDYKGQKALLGELYRLTLSQNKLRVDDAWLTNVYQKNFNRADGVVDISYEHINRIIVHALITPVQNWTELYYDVLKKVLDLLNEEPQDSNKKKLYQDSYPLELRTQLKWLTALYEKEILHQESEANQQPSTVFPMLYYPKSIKDFSNILTALQPEQITAVYESIKDHLPTLIKTVAHFGNMLSYLNPEQIIAAYEGIKNHLPTLIRTVAEFGCVLSYLNPEQITVLSESIKNHLPTLIKTADDFRNVLSYLNPEQRTGLFESIKNHLPTIIKTADDFRNVLLYLNPEQITAFKAAYEYLQAKQISGSPHSVFNQPAQPTPAPQTVQTPRRNSNG